MKVTHCVKLRKKGNVEQELLHKNHETLNVVHSKLRGHYSG